MGDKTISQISQFLKENGAITRGGKQFKDDKVKWIFPLWWRVIRRTRHEPIISKALFDKVQAVIEKRGHKEPSHKSPQAFCGLLKCSCGMGEV